MRTSNTPTILLAYCEVRYIQYCKYIILATLRKKPKKIALGIESQHPHLYAREKEYPPPTYSNKGVFCNNTLPFLVLSGIGTSK
jgi:hypothetical protein